MPVIRNDSPWHAISKRHPIVCFSLNFFFFFFARFFFSAPRTSIKKCGEGASNKT
jgi:hypothetical protein